MVFLKEKEDEFFEKNVVSYLIKYAFPLKSNQVSNQLFCANFIMLGGFLFKFYLNLLAILCIHAQDM